MPKEVLVDSGPLIALFHEKDEFHESVKETLKVKDLLLITTWPVITEVFYFLSSFKGKGEKFLEWIERGGILISDLKISDIQSIRKRIQKYSNVPMDLADATLVIIAERDSIYQILSIDSDFQIYKMSNGKYLDNILL